MDKVSNFLLSNKHNLALPGERHQVIYLPDKTYNPARFSGPGTRLDIRIPRNEPGLSYIDNVAKRHDLEYLFSQNENDVKLADEHMIQKLNQAREQKLDYPININQAELIRGKYYANRLGIPTSFFTSFGKDSIADQSIISEAERQLQELKQAGYGSKYRPRRIYKSKVGKKSRYYYRSNHNDSPMYIKSHGSGNNMDHSTFNININNPKPVRKREPKEKTEKIDIPIPVLPKAIESGSKGINTQATNRDVSNAYAQGFTVGLSKDDKRAIQDELDKTKELKTALQDQGLNNAEREDLSQQYQVQLEQIQKMRDENELAGGYIDDALSTAPPSDGSIETTTTVPNTRLLKPRVGDTNSEISQPPTQEIGTQATVDTSSQSTQTEKTDISQPPLPQEFESLSPLDGTPDPTTRGSTEKIIEPELQAQEQPSQTDRMIREQVIQDFIDEYEPSEETIERISEPRTSRGVQDMISLVLNEQQDVIKESKLTHFTQIKAPARRIKILIGEADIIPQNKIFLGQVLNRIEGGRGVKSSISKNDKETINILWSEYSQSIPKREQKSIIDKYLEQVGFGVNEDGISTKEIIALMKVYNHKTIPVIASDMIDTIQAGPLSKEIYFIMNLDPSTKTGSHWVAIAISNMDKSIMYYDSLCIHPTFNIIKGLKKLAMKMDREHMFKFKFNTVRDQSLSSGKCGFFAIQFLHKIMNGKSFKEASMYNRNYTQGENEIQKMMNGFGYI